ncbi:MAG: PAS domain-containing protein [Pseudomonadota bacterium]
MPSADSQQLLLENESLRREIEVLKASEAKWKAVLDELPDHVLLVDESGCIKYLNHTVQGISPREFIGRKFMDFMPAHLQESACRAKDQFLGTGRLDDFEMEYSIPGSPPKFLNGRVIPLKHGEGNEGFFIFYRDVTAHRQAERSLLDKQEQLQAILDNVTSIIFLKDPSGRYILASESFREELAGRHSAILGKTDFDLFPGPIAEKKLAEDQKVFAALAPCSFENSFDHQGTKRTFLTTKHPLLNPDGSVRAVCGVSTEITKQKQGEEALRQAQAELELRVRERTKELLAANLELSREIEEKKNAEKALRETREKYSLAVSAGKNGVWEIWPDEGLFFPDQNFRKMTGFGEADLGPQFSKWLTLIPLEERREIEEALQDICSGYIDGYSLEHRLTRIDGEELWLWTTGRLIGDPSAGRRRILGSSLNITERKHYEEALRRGEQIMSATEDLMALLSPGLLALSANKAFSEAFDRDGEGVVGRYLAEIVGAEVFEKMRDGLAKCLQGRRETCENWFDLPGAGEKYLQMSFYPYQDAHGLVLGAVLSSQDLTDRKKAEDALKKSETTARALLDAAPEAAFLVDIDLTILAANETAASMIGKAEAAQKGKPLTVFFPRDLADRRVARIQEAIRTKRPVKFEDEQNGVHLSHVVHPITDQTDRVIRLAVYSRDVTETKKAEETLKTMNEFRRLLFEIFPIGLTITDDSGRILEANPAFTRILGLEAKSSLEHSLARGEPMVLGVDGTALSPDEFPGVKAQKEQRIIDGVELGVLGRDGEVAWLNVTASPIPLPGFGAASAFVDISARKWAEDLLRKKTRELSKRVKELNCLFEISKLFEEKGKGLAEIFQVITELIPPAWQYPEITWSRIRVGNAAYHTANFRETRWKLSSPIMAAEKNAGLLEVGYLEEKPAAFFGPFLEEEERLVRAIAERLGKTLERQWTEEALRDSEEKARALINSTYDAVALLDRQGGLATVNETWAKLFGHKMDELKGRTMHEIMPAETAGLRLEKLERVFTLQAPVNFEDEYQGTSLENSFYPIRDSTGKVVMAALFSRDISEQVNSRKEVRAYQDKLRSLATKLSVAEEKERRQIALDLHDGVGQLLALAQIKLSRLAALADLAEYSEEFSELIGILDEAATDARSLTCEIHPPSLFHLGLSAALDEFSEHFGNIHKISTSFQDDGLPKPLDADRRVAVFRMVRELMINAAKHARAGRVVVSISRAADDLIVHVSDDGMGFDPEQLHLAGAHGRSFGLLSIKERLTHLGGRLEIQSRPGLGTTARLEAPLTVESSLSL